ncbi:hypothetical protein LCGC14_2201300, partial [marine sediment metagenome]
MLRGRYSPFNLAAFNAKLTHVLLSDMPSSTNSDHDGRYLNLDGETTDVTNGAFSLATALSATHTTGVYIDGATNAYEGEATNYIQRLTRDITGNTSNSLTSYGTSTVFDNAKIFTSTVSPPRNMITYGNFNDITVSGVHGGSIPSNPFAENNYASYNQLTRSGNLNVAASSISFNSYGSFNKVVDSITWIRSGETAVIKDYGSYNEVVQSGAESDGTMQKTGYAGYFKATGTTDGTSVLYGVYINSVSGADTNWGLFDNSGADSVIKGDLRIGSTVAPTEVLDVTGNALISGTLGAGATTLSSLVVDSPTLVVNAAEYTDRVGIGTATPGSPLHVAKEMSDHTPLVLLENLGTNSGEGDVLDVYTRRADGFTDGYIAQFRNVVGTKVYIRGDGNVGIGTTEPTSKLHIFSPDATDSWNQAHIALVTISNLDMNADQSEALLVRGGADNALTQVFEVQDYSGNADFTVWGDGEITMNGNVGIGLTTVDANYKLIIRRAADINLGIGLQSSELAIAAFNDALS